MTDRSDKTPGERAFEKYLISQGIRNFKFEPEHPGRNRRPDYSFETDREYPFDVEDFDFPRHKTFESQRSYDTNKTNGVPKSLQDASADYLSTVTEVALPL